MPDTGCYCTDTQLRIALNTNEVATLLRDGREDTTPEAIAARSLGIRQMGAQLIHGILKAKAALKSISTMVPANYTAGDGTYLTLEWLNSQISADLCRRRNPNRENDPVPPDHFVFEFCRWAVHDEADIR